MSAKQETNLEIERKFLIRRPEDGTLAAREGAVRYEIEQIYLPRDQSSESARIRKRVCGGTAEYFHTVKKRLSDLTRVEEEKSIAPEVYEAYRRLAGDTPMIITKTRWCIPHGKQTVEIDIYPFWRRLAVAEVELEDEKEEVALPEFIHVFREITGEKKYLNRTMAAELLRCGNIPEETI